jgi:DNA-binding transcriptional MerR regulator
VTSPAPTFRRRNAEAPTRTSPPRSGDVLRIGDLAARAGVSVDALRYYERRGLLRPTGRRASGYREYPPEAAALVRFIKRAQALGFTLAEVEELVRLRAAARQPAAALAAREVAAAKIRDVDDRVRQLLALRGALAELVDACESTCGPHGPADEADCPIIRALDTEGATPVHALSGADPYDTPVTPSTRGAHDDER